MSLFTRAAGALRAAATATRRSLPSGPWVLGWKRRLVWRAAELGIDVPPSFRPKRPVWDGPCMAVAKEMRLKAGLKAAHPDRPGWLDGYLRAYLAGARPPATATPGRVPPPPFIDAAVPTHGTFGPGEPSYFVIHTTSGYGSVESLASYFRNTPDGLGVQWAVDHLGRIGRYAPGSRTYHVKKHNSECEGVELVGWAVGETEPGAAASAGSLGRGHRWTRDDWLTHRRDQLDAVSWLLAFRCPALDIPLERAANGDTRGFAQERGVVGHINVPDNDHSDPGPGWPWDVVLSQARAWRAAGAVPADVRTRIYAAHNQKG